MCQSPKQLILQSRVPFTQPGAFSLDLLLLAFSSQHQNSRFPVTAKVCVSRVFLKGEKKSRP